MMERGQHPAARCPQEKRATDALAGETKPFSMADEAALKQRRSNLLAEVLGKGNADAARANIFRSGPRCAAADPPIFCGGVAIWE